MQPALAQCTRTAVAERDLDVMDRPPTYSTKEGWVYGKKIATIPEGTQIKICEEQSIGFFGSKQRWLRIQWGTCAGWVYSGYVTESHRNIMRRFYALVISDARAQPPLKTPMLPNPLIIGSFICLVLGMIAKNVFDFYVKMSVKVSMKALVIKIIPPLVISPIVFLGFITWADLGVETDMGMIIIYLFAFQNGFFWQDVLARPARAIQKV